MEWIKPMEPVLRPDIVTGGEWIHEIKWDGIRGLSYIENGRLRIYTKRRNERTAFYPELSGLTALLDAKQAVLDGEIVIFDKDGNPSFHSSIVRERVKEISRVRHYCELYPATYILFDIMNYNDMDLTKAPLDERKKILESAVGRNSTITRTDSFNEGGKLYELMKVKNWEGIVSKRKDSRYVPGKAHDLWYKTKLSRKMLAVVGGVNWKSGMPNSLLLGIYRDDSLIFIGKAGLGLKQEQIYILRDQSAGLALKECPFSRESIAGVKGDVTWFTPALTCWVHFMEFTDDGLMRHPKILGFSSSKPYEANGKEYVE